MSRFRSRFYSTNLYYKFRYYFIRQKAPLSWIFWGDILRRESSSVGLYGLRIATVGENDCAIALNRGAPKDNYIEIIIHDMNNKPFDVVTIPLSYRDMGRVMKGFDKASSISRKKIKEEAQA